jgi:hypothetical protein
MDYIYRLLKKHNVGSFKKLGNNPTALTKFNYISEVLPNIDDYFITDKADGERAFLLLKDNEKKYITSKGESHLTSENIPAEITVNGIFDCEYVHEILYIFDVLEWKGGNVSTKTFAERHRILTELNDLTKSLKTIKVKKFRKLTQQNYQQEIPAAFNEKRPYQTDGLIFTHQGADYNRTRNLKWKPPEQLTIDFLYLEKILWVGMDKKAWMQYGFPLPNNYARVVAPFVHNIMNGEMIIKNYFPVPFVCSLGDFSVFNGAPLNTEGRIVELSWDKNKNKWIFHRTREDREVELKSGHYYGNNYKVAEQTLQASLNPLTLEGLVKNKTELTKDFYFQKQDDSYKAVRKFNNYVKDVLIKQYKSDSVVDMASGKGQDLQKYTLAGVHKLLMLEIDINAIDEIINRKYDILGKLFVPNLNAAINTRKSKDSGCVLQIQQMDLNKPWKSNVSIIDKIFTQKSGSIFCNLALHYMMGDKKYMENICAFIAHNLKKDSEFIFTALDGAKVFDLVKKTPFEVSNRYLIQLVRPVSGVAKFKGFEKIKVLLPCSPDPYEEPLINIFELDKAFHKYGIVRIEHKSFDGLLQNFKEYRSQLYSELSEDDKKFIGLYAYTVYKKL